jgi:hypothetical protein
VRRLYPPLLLLLAVVVVVGLLNRGGGSASNSSSPSGSAPRSVFPTPSPVPTPTPPPVAAPAPTNNPQPVTAPPAACPPVQVNGRAVSVSILHGPVSCRSARAVVEAFKSGKGRHGGPSGNRYLMVRGWKCIPSGTCTRGEESIKVS